MPIYDLITRFTRRMLKGKSPFSPGQAHFHHILKERGHGVPITFAVMAWLRAVDAIIGLAANYAGATDAWLFLALGRYWVLASMR